MHTHTRARAQLRTGGKPRMQTHKHTRTHAQTHTHTHTHTNTQHKHKHTRTCVHTDTHTKLGEGSRECSSSYTSNRKLGEPRGGGGETKLSVLQQSVGSRLSLHYLHYLPAVHTRFVSFSMHLPTHPDPRSSNHIALTT